MTLPEGESLLQGETLLQGEHEELHFYRDPRSGLRAIIALHDTSLGPALGGIRRRRYESEQEAIADVLALAQGMTRKCALAGLPAGGGKAVILDHDQLDRPAAYRALGEAVERMGGRFFTSADLGTERADLVEVARTTRYVTDPARQGLRDLPEKTAEGVFLAAGVCLAILGIDEWSEVKLAVQGLGKIGLHLATLAARAGAQVYGADLDAEAAGRAVDTLPITLVPPDELVEVHCDVFAPCAGGGTITPAVAERLRCKLVAGAANQPLQSLECAKILHRNGVLFAPDMICSAGAVIAGCGPALANFRPPSDLGGITRAMREVVLQAMREDRPPYEIAIERADELWKAARAARVGRSG